MGNYTLEPYIPVEWITENHILQEFWKTKANMFLEMGNTVLWMPVGVQASLFAGLDFTKVTAQCGSILMYAHYVVNKRQE